MKNKNRLSPPIAFHSPLALGRLVSPLGFLMLLGALLLGGCGEDPPAKEEDGDSGRREVSIRYVEPSPETVRITQHALGSLRSLRTPEVAAEVAGRVTRLHVDEGDRVQAGDLLA
ncbi:MAG: biotin/lipoyl-binding protein [Ectothiorhodospira sp.]